MKTECYEKKRRGRRSLDVMSQERAARVLGVSREHLNYVLRGRRTSKRLLEEYKHLMEMERRLKEQTKR